MKLPVLCLAEGADWEARLVTAFGRGSHAVEIVRRCVDIVDLLAVAASGQGRVALIGGYLKGVDVDAIDRLGVAGVPVVGVIPRGDAAAEDQLRAIGVLHVVPEDADPAVIASVLSDAVHRQSSAGASGTETSRMMQRSFADPSTSMAVPPGEGDPVDPGRAPRRGSVVAVWGPTGAPGRTTVAVTLADELARLERSSLMVDADVYGGTVAAVLGLLDESPGIAAACRQAGRQRLDAAGLAALCWQLGPRLRALTGIPLASRWPELRPGAIPPVLQAARELADFTVVDLGFCLETDEELSFDTLAPRRNGATLAVLDDADLLLVVGSADPIGVQRLVRALAELGDAGIATPVWVVLNKVRSGVVPGDAAAELTAALQRFAGRAPAAMLPADAPALDAALAVGRLVGEINLSSPLRRAVADLAAAIAGVSAAPPSRRRRRR